MQTLFISNYCEFFAKWKVLFDSPGPGLFEVTTLVLICLSGGRVWVPRLALAMVSSHYSGLLDPIQDPLRIATARVTIPTVFAVITAPLQLKRHPAQE